MAIHDPIADMLTRIRNAARVVKPVVEVPSFKMGKEIVGLFKECGYIEDFVLVSSDPQDRLRIHLKYKDRHSVIKGIKRISKPSRRKYVSSKDVPYVLNGIGRAFISTSRGVLTDIEARKLGVGGEVILYVW